MKNKRVSALIWWLTIPLFAGIVYASYTGFYTPGFYVREMLNWKIQCIGQDMIDLFLVAPLLFISAWLSARKVKMAFAVWGGINLYIAYTFAIYCFDVQFNRLFLVYCLNLGLSVYSLLFFLYHISRGHNESFGKKSLFKITAVYFWVIAVLFYGLWLSGIIPAVANNMTPKEIMDIGTPTNPVHVIDLALLLPAVFATGILLWKGNSIGIRLASVILVFFVIMNITIAMLNYMMMKELPDVNPAVTWIMIALAIFSVVLLTGIYLDKSQPKSS